MLIQSSIQEEIKVKLHPLNTKLNNQTNMILRLLVFELLHKKPHIARIPNQTIMAQEQLQLPKVPAFMIMHILVNSTFHNLTQIEIGEQ